jgi:ABC-type Na+ transport system ATPase subunit NatA
MAARSFLIIRMRKKITEIVFFYCCCSLLCVFSLHFIQYITNLCACIFYILHKGEMISIESEKFTHTKNIIIFIIYCCCSLLCVFSLHFIQYITNLCACIFYILHKGEMISIESEKFTHTKNIIIFIIYCCCVMSDEKCCYGKRRSGRTRGIVVMMCSCEWWKVQ